MKRRFEYPLLNRQPETFCGLIYISMQLGLTARQIALQAEVMPSSVERWSRHEGWPYASSIPAVALVVIKMLDRS